MWDPRGPLLGLRSSHASGGAALLARLWGGCAPRTPHPSFGTPYSECGRLSSSFPYFPCMLLGTRMAAVVELGSSCHTLPLFLLFPPCFSRNGMVLWCHRCELRSGFPFREWLCGCVAVWLRGCVAVWLCGCVAVWLRGYDPRRMRRAQTALDRGEYFSLDSPLTHP